MGRYSVVVTTFLRPEKLRRCLRHLTVLYEGPEEVVVADDGDDARTGAVLDSFRDRLPLIVVDLPYDTGLSKKRNAGIERIETEYVLLLDDDQYVASNVHELCDLLAAVPQLGGVAPYWVEDGDIRANAADYTLEDGWLLKTGRDARPMDTGTDHTLYRYDHIPNAAVFRTAVFEDYTWDESFTVFEEDTDFYFTHRDIGEWEFAITPDYLVRHEPGPGSVTEFASERDDRAKMRASYDRLERKHGIRGVFHFGSHVPPSRPLSRRLLRALARHAVPNPVLWRLKRHGLVSGR